MSVQLTLTEPQKSPRDYSEAFRRLYFSLYTNSKTSRAERILENLSKLILLKLALDRAVGEAAVAEFMSGVAGANECLMPVLRDVYPDTLTAKDEFTMEDRPLRQALAEILELDLLHAPAHVIGDAVQALLGPRLRGDKGQFFTPRCLVQAMVRICEPKPGDIVVDPACGTGGFLSETWSYVTKMGSPKELQLIGIDKDADMARLAEAFTAISTKQVTRIVNGNSLDLTQVERVVGLGKANLVLTNPPFGSRISVNNPETLASFHLGHIWAFSHSNRIWERQSDVLRTQDPQILFLELCIRLLKEGGMMGIVLPEGVFGNKKTGYVWDYVRSEGTIEALLDCPRTTFQPGTDTKTNVLFFRRGKHSSSHAEEAWLAVAVNCGHDKRGRRFNSDGKPFPDDFIRCGKTYAEREKELPGSPWKKAQLDKTYYLVPRYHSPSTQLLLNGSSRSQIWKETMTMRQLEEKGYIMTRKGHEVGAEAYGTGSIPFIRTSDISNWEISVDPTKSVGQDVYEQFADRQQLRPNDVLLVVDGRYRIGRTAILHQSSVRAVVQSHIRIITVADAAPFDAYELLLLLSLPATQTAIRNLVFVQTTLGSLGPRFGELRIPLPVHTTEWNSRLAGFRQTIQLRAKLLEEVRSFGASEIEL